MKEFRVDLHLHTCLSPCGSLEMSPQRIVETALERGVDAIAVTDHNSTLQCPEIQALGEERGLMVFAGAEVTTREEAHCVALFADDRARAAFQMYLDDHLPPVPNDPERFGDQVWVNSRNEIVGGSPLSAYLGPRPECGTDCRSGASSGRVVHCGPCRTSFVQPDQPVGVYRSFVAAGCNRVQGCCPL